MSAKFNEADKNWLLGPTKNELSPQEKMIVSSTFEAQTDQDMLESYKTVKQLRFFRKFVWLKLLSSVIEIPLIFLFFSRSVFRQKLSINKLYWNFYRNKVEFNDFKKELQKVLGYSIIL
jgi:hypothetical protein